MKLTKEAVYLKANTLMRRLHSRKFHGKNLDGHELSFNNGIMEAVYIIDKMKPANVRPKVVAKWVRLGGDEWCCSNCDYVISTNSGKEHPMSEGHCNNFCRCCDAEMFKGESETNEQQ